MPKLDEIRTNATLRDATEGQLPHLAIALLMALGATALLQPSTGTAFWISALAWAKLSIWLAVAHQVMVAFVFRAQLYNSLMTRAFGGSDLRVWGAMFFPFLLARPLTVLLAAIADTGTLALWWPAAAALGTILIAIAAWTMHSVLTHFTLPRALGGDHFRDEYLAMPMVQTGVFRYTGNGMYGLGFLGLWGIALLFNSWNALVVAFFQHAYIWVHMYFTEKPDMDRLYGTE
ncbi:MAG: PEMT/PEM2 family methyltransferase [Paracoccaceae bacterium]